MSCVRVMCGLFCVLLFRLGVMFMFGSLSVCVRFCVSLRVMLVGFVGICVGICRIFLREFCVIGFWRCFGWLVVCLCRF